MPMVGMRLVNGRGQNGVESVYMMHQLSEITGKAFRDLGLATKEGGRFSFVPRPGINLESCDCVRMKNSPAGKGLIAMLEEQLARGSARA